MLVSRSSFDFVVEQLSREQRLSLDSETTGLRPYHGDRLFSLILGRQAPAGASKPEAFYFNFWPSYTGLDPEFVLPKSYLKKLAPLWDDPAKLWFMHKFNFDMHFLGAEGIELAGEVFCTLTQGRVEYNEHPSYSLADSLERIGLAKDDTVEKIIDRDKLWEWQSIPGKTQRKKNKFYYKVPHDIIVPYGLSDATGCFHLGVFLQNSIGKKSSEYPPGVPSLLQALEVEKRLAHTVYRMEKVGVRIDRPYCVRAARYEANRAEQGSAEFKRETGREYCASPKLFAEIFSAERERWVYTEKGNPSFDSDLLKGFKGNLAAKAILQIRDAKAKLDFYNGFLWHADKDDIIHGQFNPGGTRTFRFSSSEPNLQNMSSEEASYCKACDTSFEEFVDLCPDCQGEAEHPEFMVRRAIIPRPGYIFLLPDFDQMEYKMMLDYAKHMQVIEFKRAGREWDEGYFEVANKVRDGFDVHRATGELMGVPRKYAKTLNFLLLYGGGPGKLAAALGIPLEEAYILRSKYFRALPYVQFMISQIEQTIRERGWIRNWAGYKYNFPNRGYAYTGPNTIIQGGCAAVNKVAMNRLDERFKGTKSRLVLTIHDENPCEIHESEIHTLPKLVQQDMESVYPYKYIPLTCGMEWSSVSLADKRKGFPT